jgi:hypothetical protein
METQLEDLWRTIIRLLTIPTKPKNAFLMRKLFVCNWKFKYVYKSIKTNNCVGYFIFSQCLAIQLRIKNNFLNI